MHEWEWENLELQELAFEAISFEAKGLDNVTSRELFLDNPGVVFLSCITYYSYCNLMYVSVLFVHPI